MQKMKRWRRTGNISLAMMATVVAVAAVVPASAEARSYQSSATRAAFNWSKSHHPSGAIYAYARCFSIGYQEADCSIEFATRYGEACSYEVTVSGRYYHVRKYDSTC